jgi:enamine deaminase RidA (YjgF/YER057c/UK114 family)
MVENVEELLKEADMKLDDIAQAIVYLRDLCDYEIVKPMLTSLLGNTPLIFTLAPVCRPEWLIEMECIGIKKSYTEEFKSFS